MSDSLSGEEELGLRSRLLHDVMDKTMAAAFQRSYQKEEDLYTLFQKLDEKEVNKICNGENKYKEKLQPKKSTHVDIVQFDTKLLANLLIVLCKKDFNSDEIKTIVDTRNIISHRQLSITSEDFNRLYKEVKVPLLNLGCTVDIYNSVRDLPLGSRQFNQRYNLSLPVHNFVGRKDELNTLTRIIENFQDINNQDKRLGVVITGVPSVGKSELLWQSFVNVKKSPMTNIFCLNASTTLKLEISFRKLAAYAFPNEDHKDRSMIELVERVLLAYAKTFPLFVLENVSEVDKTFQKLISILNTKHAKVLITTVLEMKKWKCEKLFHFLPLGVFSQEDAILFVKTQVSETMIGPDELDLIEFVENCRHHPYTLNANVSFIKKRSRRFPTLAHWNEAFYNGNVSSATPTNSISQTLTLSQWNKEMQDMYGEHILSFLKLVCILNCHDLKKQTVLQLVSGNEEASDQIINRLKELAMLRVRSAHERVYTIPSIWVEEIRNRVGSQTIKSVLEIMFKELRNEGTERIYHHDVWDGWYVHYCFMFDQFKERDDAYEHLVHFTYESRDDLTYVFRNKGMIHKWYVVLQIVSQRMKILSYSAHKLVKMKLKLIECCLEEGRLRDCYDLLQVMENGDEFKECTNLPSVIFDHKYFKGCCLQKFGLYDEAIQIFEGLEKTSISKQQRISIQNNIFICFRRCGKLQKALKSFNKLISLSSCKKPWSDWSEWSVVAGNMALCLQQLRKFDQSLQLYDEVLMQQECTYGKLHPTYLKTLTNKGSYHKDVGELDHALKLFEEVLASFTTTHQLVGSTHLLYLTALNLKGKCLLEYRRYKEAMICFEEVREGREKKLGLTDPAYYNVLMNMALCLGEQKECLQAIDQLNDLKEKIRKTLGGNYPLLVDVQHCTAKCHFINAQYENALEEYREISECLSAQGRDSLVHETKSMIGRCYLKLNNVGEALKLFRKLEKEQIKMYEHTNDALLLETKRDISECLMRCGQTEKAYEMLLCIKQMQIIKLKSVDHPSLVETEILITQTRDGFHCVDKANEDVLGNVLWDCSMCKLCKMM